MSTDNYILINRKNFIVKELNASDGSVIRKIGKGRNLEDAIDIACEETKTGKIEFGIEFTDKNYKLKK